MSQRSGVASLCFPSVCGLLAFCCLVSGCGYLGLDLRELGDEGDAASTGEPSSGDASANGGTSLGGASTSGEMNESTETLDRGDQNATGGGTWWGGGGNGAESWDRWRSEGGIACVEPGPHVQHFATGDSVTHGRIGEGVWGIDLQRSTEGAGSIEWTDQEGFFSAGALAMRLDSKNASRWRMGSFVVKTVFESVDLTDGLLVVHLFSESGQNVSATLLAHDLNGNAARSGRRYLDPATGWDCLSLDLSAPAERSSPFDSSRVIEVAVEVTGNWDNWTWNQDDLVVYLDDFSY